MWENDDTNFVQFYYLENIILKIIINMFISYSSQKFNLKEYYCFKISKHIICTCNISNLSVRAWCFEKEEE